MSIIRNILCFLSLAAVLSLASCGAGDSNRHLAEGVPIEMKYAKNLSMTDYGDYIEAAFRNPWDTTKTLQTYYLVPKDAPKPAGLPKRQVIPTPLSQSVVYTAVHNSLITELGGIDDIAGVCDAQYIKVPEMQRRIAEGRVEDCGSNMAPNIEKILMLSPEAILLSAFENSNDHNKVAQLGIPIIDCIDYMEVSPLARAEWMRFFGRLYDKADVADSLFEVTEREYLEIKDLVSECAEKPQVMCDLIYGQAWYVPGAQSTFGTLIHDAGAATPFDEYQQSGSVQLAPEQVLYGAKDADIWLLRYSQKSPMTLTQLGAENPIYRKFRSFNTGEVYGCNVDSSTFFEDTSFHPQWILAEFAHIFHPEIIANSAATPSLPEASAATPYHSYFEKLQP